METPPLARYIPQKSKKRVFPGGSSSCMDPEVIEIPPPVSRSSKSKSLKQKEVVLHEVIDIDMDEDSADVMLIDQIDTNNRGKETIANPLNGHSSTENPGTVDGVQSTTENSALGPHNFINLDGSDLSYGDDEYLDMYYDDLMFDDEYSMLQAHFDSIDIPPGVEAPIPWLSNPPQNKNHEVSNLTSSSLQVQSDAHLWGFPESTPTRKISSAMNSVNSKIQLDSVSQPRGTEPSPTWSLQQFAKSKKKLASSSSSTYSSSQQKGSWSVPEHSRGKRKLPVSSTTTWNNSSNQVGSVKLSPVNEHPSWGSSFPNSLGMQVGNGYPNQPFFLPMNTTPPVYPDISSLYASSEDVHIFPGGESYTPWVQDPAIAAGSSSLPLELVSSAKNLGNESDILKKFQDFKKFDTVQDHSDHHYSRSGSSQKQPSKNWAKKIQEEWKILEKDLPDTIFVRVYESRMDLLRAVMVGAEGTPYHDGLFFFDVFFPSGYPNVPPHVHYHSGGLRINPNLYNCGKVCLSLLNTWTGNKNEKWFPGVSTMLQVLVSIQGLILNAEPFYNEPGYAGMSGSADGQSRSKQYNENTFILSLKTMVYTMRRPPKHFEDFVVGHFYNHARDVLVACKAYTDGAQVGCLAKGGVQDVDAGDKSCSLNFKGTLAGNITTLIEAFKQIGAKDCEKFISPVEKGNGVAPPAPNAANVRWY